VRFPDGIAAQPDSLRTSAKGVAPQIADLVAPGPDEVIGLLGIGGNGHGATGAANAWRARGLRAVALDAGELVHGPFRVADTYVVLSESGRSTETLRALERLGTARTIAITNDETSPVAQACTERVTLGSGPDSSVYTTGYTATLQALGLLGRHWGPGSGDTTATWTELPDLVADVLEQSGRLDAAADAIDRSPVVDVVGSGVSLASAGEGALLLRECARLRTAHFETHNYLHGPMEVLDRDVACVVVGNGREATLARDVAALGCPTLHIGTDVTSPEGERAWAIPLPACDDPLASAILEIVVIQQLGWAVAERRGLAVDGFRHPQADTKVGS
jgi:glucosamine--fructose-6-phosphate aminotransferase (isomerizing)